MLKQGKTFAEELAESRAQEIQQTTPDPFRQTAATPILVTSTSQVAKARAGKSIDFYKTLYAQSDESKELIEMEKAKIEERKKLIPEKGSINETYKELKGEKAYETFVKNEEKLNTLRKKTGKERDLATLTQVGAGVPNMVSPGADIFRGAAALISNLFLSPEEQAEAIASPNSFTPGRTKEEDKEYKELKQKKEIDLRPVALIHTNKVLEENRINALAANELLKKRNELYAITGENTVSKKDETPGFTDAFNYIVRGKQTIGGKEVIKTPEQKELQKVNQELYLLGLAKKQNDDTLKKLTDFTEGKNGLWDGLLNHTVDIGTMGVKNMVIQQHVAGVAEKLDKLVAKFDGDDKLAWEALNAGEKEVMKAFNKGREVDSMQLQEDNWAYHNANGLGQSLVFVAGLVGTGGVNTMLKGGTKLMTQAVTKNIVANTVKGSLRRKIGIAITEKILPNTLAVAGQTLAHPMTYTGMARKYTGNTQLITDPDGTQRIVVRKGAYNQFMKEYDENKSMLNEMYTELVRKTNRTPEEEAEMSKIVEQFENLEEEKKMLLEQSQVTKGTAFAYGATETAKEMMSELYVGRVGAYGAKAFGKSSMGQWLTGSTLGKASKWVGELYKSGSNMISNTGVGKISSRAMHHTGGNRIYHGLWGELAEEIVVQATPTLTENYLDQLEELVNPSFYADVVSQTILMSGGVASLGLAGQVWNFKKSKGLYDNRRAIRESYRRMDKAVTDDELAETIVMSTAGTGFSLADYNLKVSKLRREGKTDQANKLEEKKFYNMALKAIQTNTLDEFEKALKTAQENAQTDETSSNIGSAIRSIEELKKVYEKYQGKTNIGNIIELASQKITNKKSIEHLDHEMETQRALADNEINSVIAREGLDLDPISANEILDREITDDESGRALTKLIQTLEKEHNPAFNTYMDLVFAKENLQYAQHQTMKAFNEQTSPTYQNKAENVKAIDRQVKKTISFIEENQISEGNQLDPTTGRLVITDSFIDNVFDNIDTMGLNKKEIESLKDQYKEQIKQQNNKTNVESIEQIFQLYEAKEKAKAAQIQTENQPLEVEKTKIENPVLPIIKEKTEEEKLKEQQEKEFVSVKTEEVTFMDIESEESTPAVITQQAMEMIEKATQGITEEAPLFSEEELGGTIKNPNADFSLSPRTTPEFDDAQLGLLQTAMKTMYEQVKKQIHREPTFKELISHFVKYQGKETAQKFFDAYKMGWERNNYEATNYEEVYNEVFEPLKSTVDDITTMLEGLYGVVKPIEELNPDQLVEETTKEELKKQELESVVINFTEENIPVTSLHGNRVDSSALRLGFNAIEYIEVKQSDGTYKRVPIVTDNLNTKDDVIDFKDLLNPDLHNVGDSLGVGVAPKDMWGTIRIAVGRDENNNVITKSFAEIVAEKTALDENFLESQEFRDTVPMFAFDSKGKLLAHIHETGWYNQWNVADPARTKGTIDPNSTSKSQADLIKEARETISALRGHILDGKVSKIKITEKTEGAFYTIENRKDSEGNIIPLYTIQEANPDAVLAVQMGAGLLETSKGVPFENEKRKLTNQPYINEKGGSGHTWNLRRIGIDPKDGRETWQALKVVRYATEEQLETIKWAWAAYSLFDTTEQMVKGKKVQLMQDIRKENLPPEYELTKEEATQIIKDIKKITGYNLMRFDEANTFFKLFLQPRGGDSNLQFGRTIYSGKLSNFSQHTSSIGLKDNTNVVHIDGEGKVVDTGKSYQEYLKSTLTTGVKSFNVGTVQKPVYATSVQPTIRFEYKLDNAEPKSQETVVLDAEKAKKAALEAMEELVGETSAEMLITKAKDLISEMGFSLRNMSFAPSTLQGTNALESIFAVTPGLDIKQESQLVNYIYNFILAAIDIKYKSKVSTAQVLAELKTSYNDMVLPSRDRIDKLLSSLVALEKVTPSESISNTIVNLQKVLSSLNNIEVYWNTASIKEHLEAIGEEYSGQKGIVEKALEEVYKTSDIKEAKESVEEIADELENEEDVSIREKNYSENSNLTEDGKGKITYRLRRFMSGIKRLDKTGNEVKGFLGLTDYMNFNEVYDNIYQLLGDGVYIQSDYNVMRDKIMEMAEAKPWVKELMTRFDTADIQMRKEFVYNYRKHAVNMKFAMYSTGTQGTVLQVFDTNANEITRVITTEWKNNIKTTPLSKIIDGQYSINLDVANALLEEYNSWGTEGHLQPDKVVKEWLANFGLNLSDEYFEELKTEGFKSKGKIIAYPMIFKENTPIGLLGKYLNRVVKEKDLKYEDNVKAHPLNDMNDIVKALAKGESKYTAKMISKSFRDAGKNISGITNPTHLTDKIGDLKRAALDGDKDGILAKLGNISITSQSIMLELFKNDPNFAAKVNADYLGITALKELGGKSGNFSSITDLNSMDHDITKLTMFQNRQQGTVDHKINGIPMRIARMFLPTMSDKSQMLTVSTGVFDFMSVPDVFETNEDGDLIFGEDVRELIYQRLILPEMKRISKFHENGAKTNISDYKESAQIFNFFPALNNVKDENGERIIMHLATTPLAKVEEFYKEQLTDTVEEILHSMATKKMEIWQDKVERDPKGAIKNIPIFDSEYLSKGKGNLDEKFKVATYDFILNSVLSNADMFVLLAGDPAIFGQSKNFKKENKVIAKIQNDDFFITQAKKQGVNIGKRLALLIAPGSTLADSQGKTYKQIFLTDRPQMSENMEYLISLYYGKDALNEPAIEGAKMTVKEALQEFKTTKQQSRKAVIKEALAVKFEKIGDYFDLASTDAQEYSTVKERISILLDQGRLSQEEYDRIQKTLEEGKTLNKEEIGLVMQPIKPVYTGQILDEEQDAIRTIYIKSSSFPLLPQLTAGLKLDGLRVAMENLEIKYGESVRASYFSANKVGSMTKTIDPLSSESLREIEGSMLTLDRTSFRIQQDVPFKSDKKKKDEIAMGTQIFKLLFGDGMLQQTGFRLNPTDTETISGQELYEQYKETIFSLIDIKTQELYKELGLSVDGKVVSPEVSTKKLQDLLQKEAIKRDYPIKDIKGLELEALKDKNGNTYYEFKIPLWLSSNSNRYESLLNAIVTNRVLKHKIPGSSFVVGSENGFSFKEGLEGIEKSRTIYLNGWNGEELKGVTVAEDGTMTKAQILVPSKFKGPDGKLIDLFQLNDKKEYVYLKTNENGSLGLNETMIDPELLTSFTFRTPTSAHVSASSVEIVGILPPESGDLMIVPKNFTAQKGLDFDVDKENAYQYNHVVNYKTKKIEILTEKHKEKALKKLTQLLNDIDLEREKIKRAPLAEEILEIINKRELEVGAEFTEEGVEGLSSAIDKTALDILADETKTEQEKYDAISNEYDLKLLENKFIKIHNAVFSNPNPEVQKKINKVLSMDNAREQANLIQEWTEIGAKKETISMIVDETGLSKQEAAQLAPSAANDFTILSDEYQKEKMGLGAAGQMAIGVYSNYVTFHSLVQQADKSIRLKEFDGEEMIDKTITIGNIKSEGLLGLQMSLTAPGYKGTIRSVAEAFAERQNTATDNEKEQILGRVNVTSETIGVDSLLTALGFDKDENGNSISYTLLSQPILKQYIKALQDARGVTSEYQKDLKNTVINNLLKGYSNGAYIFAEDKVTLNPSHSDFEKLKNKDLDSQLSAENLENGIKTNGKDGLVQVATLAKFLEVDNYAKQVAKAQSLLNTKSLGKSIIESNATYVRLETIADGKGIENITSLFGDFIPIEESPTRPDGYITIGQYYVKPTTPQGKIVITGLTTGQELWSKYFPYNDPYMKIVMDAILKESNVDISSSFKLLEAQQEIIEETKKFIFSGKGLGIFTEIASVERARLFMDTATNTSLANYLNSNSRDENLIGNKLLNTFTYDVNTNGLPSIIKYNNTISNNLDEKYLYNSLAELMIEDKPLPDKDGKPFSTRQLAQELITYTYIEGGIQEAIQFMKYVPIEYLSEIGIQQGNEFVTANTLIQRVSNFRDPNVFRNLLGVDDNNPMDSVFIKQFFQHYPKKAKKYSSEEVKKFAMDSDGNFNSGIDPKEAPKFITIPQKTKSKLKQDKNYLFEHIGGGSYVRIDVLGTHGMNEYELGNTNATSLLTKKVVPPIQDKNDTKLNPKQNLDLTPVQTGKSVRDITQSIANSKDPKMARMKLVAQALLPMLDDTTKVKVVNMSEEVGMEAGGAYDSTNNTIYISEKEAIKESVFIHELIHSISKRELQKYYSMDADGFYTLLKDNAPAHVIALNEVWKIFMKSVPDAIIQSTRNKTKALHSGQAVTLTREESELGYAAVDIFEFLSVGLESRYFQSKMSEIPFGENQTLRERFIEIITQILQAINPSITKGSVAEASVAEILNFISIEQKANQENAIFASIEPDLFKITPQEMQMIREQQMIDDAIEREEFNGNIEDEIEGPPDVSLIPSSVSDPFNQNC